MFPNTGNVGVSENEAESGLAEDKKIKRAGFLSHKREKLRGKGGWVEKDRSH